MKSMMTLVALVAAAGSAHAATVAYWAFPTTAPAQNYNITWPINADLKANAGLATLDADAPKYDGSAAPNAIAQGSMQLFTGDNTGALPGFAATTAISMRNDSQDRGQGKSIILRFDASGFQNMVLSFAERYSSTGPQTTTISYSGDGVNYTTATSYSNTRSGAFLALRTVNLSAASGISFNSAAYVKITFSQFNAGSNGSARLDNILIDGTFIPAPGSMALLAIGGLVAGRRRRA
jgi:hypothetical protein